MELIRKKIALVLVASLILLGAGTHMAELNARDANQGRRASTGRNGSRAEEGRRQTRRGESRRDARSHRRYRDRYDRDYGEGLVPAAVGLGVGAAALAGDTVVGTEEAVLGDRDCPRGTYFDEESGECIEEVEE